MRVTIFPVPEFRRRDRGFARAVCSYTQLPRMCAADFICRAIGIARDLSINKGMQCVCDPWKLPDRAAREGGGGGGEINEKTDDRIVDWASRQRDWQHTRKTTRGEKNEPQVWHDQKQLPSVH